MVRSVKEAAASWNMDLGRNIFKRVTMVCEAAVFSKRVNLKQMQLGAYLAAGVASPSTCISRAGLLRGTCPTGTLPYGLRARLVETICPCLPLGGLFDVR
jgi:hypothetical protein